MGHCCPSLTVENLLNPVPTLLLTSGTGDVCCEEAFFLEEPLILSGNVHVLIYSLINRILPLYFFSYYFKLILDLQKSYKNSTKSCVPLTYLRLM